jgi:hypothetical protein
MNKEQFKISISNLINYYLEYMVNYNITLREAVAAQNGVIISMVDKQMDALNSNFYDVLDAIVAEVFPDEDNDDVVEANED